MKKLIFIAALALMGCTQIAESPLIVKKIEAGCPGEHKYHVFIDAFPGDVLIQTNKEYKVGDTIK